MGFPKAEKLAAARPVNGLLKFEQGDFTRLVRVIARQAAREAFGLFSDVLEKRAIQAGLSCNPNRPEIGRQNSVLKTHPSPEQAERFLSVAEVALRLDVSEKTVRRMIKRGDLRAQRVGRLIRVAERDLADCLGNPSTNAIVRKNTNVNPR
jgi:excisionase family DNA binding protein